MDKENLQETYCNCLYYSAGALGRVMNKLAEEAFAPIGLSPSHAFLVMSVHWRPGLQPGQLSQQMMLEPSTITRLIEKLEAAELVERKKDGKNVYVYPGKKGALKFEQAKKAWQELLANYTKKLGKKEAEELTRLAYRAVAKLER
ncbi:MAG: MarR family transcriptional regulator [Leptospiraceae bacterium]|nr:MarR family transcriptional regulator [Leptospiraceae bacterium]